MEREILLRLDALNPGTTMCPGKLAREVGGRLAELRPVLLGLARSRKLKVTQRGKPADLEKLKGPFRVGKK